MIHYGFEISFLSFWKGFFWPSLPQIRIVNDCDLFLCFLCVANSDVSWTLVFLRWAQPVGFWKYQWSKCHSSIIMLLNGACYKGLTLEKKLIDRRLDGLMTGSIPVESGRQRGICGKLCTNCYSSQHPPSCQPASDWWGKWLMTAVSLLSATPRQPCPIQLLPRKESISLPWQVWQSRATWNLGLLHPVRQWPSCLSPHSPPAPDN